MPTDKSTRRKYLVTSAGVVGLTSIAGCFGNGGNGTDGGGGGGGGDSVNLQYSTTDNEGSILANYIDGFAEKAAQKSDGQIQIDTFYSDQLGGLTEQAEDVTTGALDMLTTAYSFMGDFLPEYAVFDIPYMYQNWEHAALATTPSESEVMDEINQRAIEQIGVRNLSGLIFGRSSLVLNQEVCTMDGMSGLTIRIPPGEISQVMVEAWGANPVAMDYSEVAQALSTGDIDGLETPAPSVLTANYQDVASHFVRTEHFIRPNPTWINEQVWQGLTDEQKSIMRESANEMRQENIDEAARRHEEAIDEIRGLDSMTVVDPQPEGCLEKEAFRTAVLDAMRENFPEWSDYIETLSDCSNFGVC